MARRSMAFIDGTNLFYRLQAERLALKSNSLIRIMVEAAVGTEIVRAYLYTSPPHWEKALKTHEVRFANQIRTVLGEAIPTGDGNFREKGVDARLVADMIYHAASRNIERAIVVSADQDFVHALGRVEDFGCRTSVVGICAKLPLPLKTAGDQVFELDHHYLLSNQLADHLQKT